MTQHYINYCWKDGIPYGIQKTDSCESITYRILSDPYNKWISIEQYENKRFEKVIYDSFLFDFRILKTLNQAAWKKETLYENDQTMCCLIRNQDDRAVLLEKYFFTKGKCRECHTSSIHGLAVSHQKIYYKSLNDPFNGVVLFDTNTHIVMEKRYDVDKMSGEFNHLLSENWRMKTIPIPG